MTPWLFWQTVAGEEKVGLPGIAPPHGIIHILDAAEPSSIHKISTFELPKAGLCKSGFRNEWFQATDMVVKGDSVYLTWLRGGLHVVDISDPTTPAEVGEFRPSPITFPNGGTGPWLSDVAMYGNHVVAGRFWMYNLYVLRMMDTP